MICISVHSVCLFSSIMVIFLDVMFFRIMVVACYSSHCIIIWSLIVSHFLHVHVSMEFLFEFLHALLQESRLFHQMIAHITNVSLTLRYDLLCYQNSLNIA